MPRPLASLVVGLALAAACANPPVRELHQAQGAIDAARAAGADEYAPAELDAAQSSLRQAEVAINQRDYRLALSHALDARESAQEAAREAADQKALVRSEAEHTLIALTAAMTRAEARARALRNVRAAASAVAATEQAIRDVNRAVQEARAALADGRYLAARDAMKGDVDRITAVIADLEAAGGSRRRR